jgi:von Willebrand factor type A domain
MKPSVVSVLISLGLLAACSSPSDGDKSSATGGAGATSSPTAGGTSSTSAGAGPNLDTGGSLSLDQGGSGGQPLVANGECAQQNFVLASKPADVLLVLDRSKSMIEHTVPPMDLTRWDAVVAALTAVISETDATVSWGLKLFPEGEGKSCIETSVTDAIPAEIMPRNAAKVNGVINTTEALGNGTPTGDAIAKAASYLKSRGVSNQYIVLATDGEPSCPSGDDAVDYAVEKIAEAKAAGFPTYVIGVLDPDENESSFPRLNKMAEAGGTARNDASSTDKFYNAYSVAELTKALEAVTGQVASCVFEFEKAPPDASNIAVKVNGAVLAQDTNKAQGWDYTSDQHLALELYGDACQQIKGGTENKVDIIFGCKGVPIK